MGGRVRPWYCMLFSLLLQVECICTVHHTLIIRETRERLWQPGEQAGYEGNCDCNCRFSVGQTSFGQGLTCTVMAKARQWAEEMVTITVVMKWRRRKSQDEWSLEVRYSNSDRSIVRRECDQLGYRTSTTRDEI